MLTKGLAKACGGGIRGLVLSGLQKVVVCVNMVHWQVGMVYLGRLCRADEEGLLCSV